MNKRNDGLLTEAEIKALVEEAKADFNEKKYKESIIEYKLSCLLKTFEKDKKLCRDSIKENEEEKCFQKK